MSSVNKVILIGNMGRDPELRYTSSGSAICNAALATSRKWKDKDGNKQEETEWHRVVFYDKLAEIAGEYLKKGKPVYVEGRLKTRKWTDKDGVEKYTTEIIAQEMQLLGSRDEPADAPAKPQTQRSRAEAWKAGASGGDMDDIPFADPYKGKKSFVV